MSRTRLMTGAAVFMLYATGIAAAQDSPSPATATKPVFMSPQWATQLCTAWNKTPQLTKGLGGGWAQNTGGKPYKVITLSDSICKVSAPVELKIAQNNGLAECIYGGALTATSLDYSHDYSMWATTTNWLNMGSPMTAMMFGRLNFKGPKLEAMRNMGPFGGFLHLVPKVPASFKFCPPKGPGLPQ